jgi:translation initiation factor 2 subunit 3
LGVLTELDPFLTKADSLTGSLAGKELPPILNKISFKPKLFEKIIEKIEPLRLGEHLMINVGTARTLGIVKNLKDGVCDLELKLPICAEKGDRIVLSRTIAERWRLIGWGLIE